MVQGVQGGAVREEDLDPSSLSGTRRVVQGRRLLEFIRRVGIGTGAQEQADHLGLPPRSRPG